MRGGEVWEVTGGELGVMRGNKGWEVRKKFGKNQRKVCVGLGSEKRGTYVDEKKSWGMESRSEV